jgi:predicted metal-binding membrane protein
MDPTASSRITGLPDRPSPDVVSLRSSRFLGWLRHDRAILVAAIAAIAALAWAHLLRGAGTGMSTFAMTSWRFPLPAEGSGAGTAWDPAYATLMLLMWWTMMIAMMLPSATPFILLHARVTARAMGGPEPRRDLGSSMIFLSGYLLVWLVFSVLATAIQWVLEASGLLDGIFMWSRNAWLSGCLLIATGLYQLTPIKAVCLSHCRSPVTYLSSHWKNGSLGALAMGLAHGAYCLGCCWLLMALLFVGGAMNLVWIAGLSIIVLIEKLAPAGLHLGRALGVLLVAVGIIVMAGASTAA